MMPRGAPSIRATCEKVDTERQCARSHVASRVPKVASGTSSSSCHSVRTISTSGSKSSFSNGLYSTVDTQRTFLSADLIPPFGARNMVPSCSHVNCVISTRKRHRLSVFSSNNMRIACELTCRCATLVMYVEEGVDTAAFAVSRPLSRQGGRHGR